MKSDRAIRDMLDKMLAAELTAHRLYFVHSEISRSWGFDHLAQHFKEEAELALYHAESIVQRILQLDGFPDINHMHMVQNGETCRQQLQLQHDFETKHIKSIKSYALLCVEKNDLETGDLLDEILKTSEEQVDWLETQRRKIREIGVDSYLQEHSLA